MNASLPRRFTGDSRPVRTAQRRPHTRLDEVVTRHLRTGWRQPPHASTVEVFGRVSALLRPGEVHSLVLDSGCGSGASTRLLSQRHPDAVVLGLDRSAHRLRNVGAADAPRRVGDVIWARAELATFWRLAVRAGWRCSAHYLLYPNPWPKPGHLRRRWHGHPVFPALLALGGALELRSNWRIYVEEFARTLHLAGHLQAGVEQFTPDLPLTPFERKYHASGHALWRCRADLDQNIQARCTRS